MPEKIEITEPITDELDFLFQFVAPKDLYRSVVEVYFTHVMRNTDEVFSSKFAQHTGNVYFLLKFLEVVEDDSGEISDP
jgi:hypothetical protein